MSILDVSSRKLVNTFVTSSDLTQLKFPSHLNNYSLINHTFASNRIEIFSCHHSESVVCLRSHLWVTSGRTKWNMLLTAAPSWTQRHNRGRLLVQIKLTGRSPALETRARVRVYDGQLRADRVRRKLKKNQFRYPKIRFWFFALFRTREKKSFTRLVVSLDDGGQSCVGRL